MISEESGILEIISEVRKLLALRDAIQAELPALAHAIGQLSNAFAEIQESLGKINQAMN